MRYFQDNRDFELRLMADIEYSRPVRKLLDKLRRRNAVDPLMDRTRTVSRLMVRNQCQELLLMKDKVAVAEAKD